LNTFAAGVHERFEASLTLLVAGSLVRSGVPAEAESLLVHDDVDVLGEAPDEFPRFRERGATFECEVFTDSREGKEFAQRPTNPEVP
jgi:hypothetical protein